MKSQYKIYVVILCLVLFFGCRFDPPPSLTTTQYSVSYDANGATSGTVPANLQFYSPYYIAIEVKGNTGNLRKTGFAFAGWNSKADGLGTFYPVGSNFFLENANLVLYAVWSTPYTVTYFENGATAGVAPVDDEVYASGTTVTALGNPGNLTKTGYSFAGWVTAPSADTPSISVATGASFVMGPASITLQAIWIPDGLSFSSEGNAIRIDNGYEATFVTLDVPYGVTGIGMLQISTLVTISLPSTIASVYGGSFNYCGNLASITVDNSNPAYKSISGVLYDKAGTTLVRVPPSMTSFTVPPGVLTIAYEAIGGYSNLTDLTVPASLVAWGQNPFAECGALTNLVVNPANPNFQSTGDVLYNKTKTVLLGVSKSFSGAFTFPVGITSIADKAFSGCQNLTSVSIPSEVTSIGDWAFDGCAALAQVVLPPNITTIGSHMFTGCVALTSIVIPAGVTHIGNWAFADCTGLTSIIVPDGVTWLEDSAFYRCYGLQTVILGAGLTHLGGSNFLSCTSLTSVTMRSPTPPFLYAPSQAFDGTAVTLQIHVPQGSLSAYQTASGWSKYASLLTYP